VDKRRARELAKSLIPDIDGVLAGEHRPIEDRHSAGASAIITATRLFGGLCVNMARIAAALEDIADEMERGNEQAAPRGEAVAEEPS
jgi:hypothetical protein